MIIGLITGALLAAAVVGVLSAFWEDIRDFLKKAFEKVRQVVQGVIAGAKIFLKKIREAVQEISKNYSKVDKHWEETIVTRTVHENEVPEEFRNRISYDSELDITREMEMQLQSA